MSDSVAKWVWPYLRKAPIKITLGTILCLAVIYFLTRKPDTSWELSVEKVSVKVNARPAGNEAHGTNNVAAAKRP